MEDRYTLGADLRVLFCDFRLGRDTTRACVEKSIDVFDNYFRTPLSDVELFRELLSEGYDDEQASLTTRLTHILLHWLNLNRTVDEFRNVAEESMP